MLSVLMSVYYREHPECLHEAFQSLVLQTVQPAEVVLVKDGPLTSELDAVIDGFRRLLPFNVVALPENVGLARALNYGLQFVSQPWVMRFDTDDVCAADRVEKQVALIKKEEFDLFGAQIDEFEHDFHFPVRVRQVPCEHDQIVRFCLRRNPFNHMTVCFKKAIVLGIGGYPDIAFMEDYALWIKIIASGARVCNVSDVLVHVRIGNGMIRRRGGYGYIISEWRLQGLMHSLGLKTIIRMLVDGFMRSIIFISPVGLRGFVYQVILRRKVNKS
jgi:GT2 family glycosyltransferase